MLSRSPAVAPDDDLSSRVWQLRQFRPRFGKLATDLFGVDPGEVVRCLHEHAERGGRIGDCLVGCGALKHTDVVAILRQQAKWTVAAIEALLPDGSGPFRAGVPPLSLCFPAYNEEENIRETLDAAFAVLPAIMRS